MMRKIIEFCANVFSCVFPILLFDKLNIICNIFYTSLIARKFCSIGKHPTIMRWMKLHGAQNISIGDNFYCYWGVRIETYNMHNGVRFNPKIVIGHNVSINPYCHIAAINNVEIHDGVLIASHVFITDHFHGDTSFTSINIPPRERILETKGCVVIKKNAWLGEGVAVMPGVTIGCNAIIGANSVVTNNIPDNAIAVGVPARVIKQY